MPPCEIAVDLTSNTVITGTRHTPVTRRLAEIIWVLADAWPEIVALDRLITRVWGYVDTPHDEIIRVHVTSMRKVLRPLGWTVKNQYGVGYRLVRL